MIIKIGYIVKFFFCGFVCVYFKKFIRVFKMLVVVIIGKWNVRYF